MRNLVKIFSVFSFSVLLLIVSNPVFAQHKKNKLHRSTKDSLRHVVLKRDSLMRTFKHSDNSLNELLQKIESYNSTYNDDFSDLTQGFDTVEVSANLPLMEKRMALMGTLIQNEHSSSLGYLFSIRDLMEHFKEDLDDWQKNLAEDNTKLNKILNDANDFKSDTAMHTVPTDSSLRERYLTQVIAIQKKWELVNIDVKKDLIKIGLLQNRVTTLDLLMLDLNDRIDQKISDFSKKSFTNETGFIWEKSRQQLAPFDTVVSKTTRLNSKLLKYFFDFKTTNHINFISDIAYILIFISFYAWTLLSRRKLTLSKDDHQDTLNQTHYLVKRSVVAALLLATLLALYLYDTPPFIFLEILLILMMVCIGVLIKPIWPKPLFKLWIGLFFLMIAYATTNLFTQLSYTDRWLLLVLSLLSAITGFIFLKITKASTENYPPHTRMLVVAFSVINTICVILNIIGRFSLAKTIGVAACFNICLGFGFYLGIQIIMESLFLQLEANKNATKSFSSYVDFKVLQNKFKNVLVKIFFVLWVVKLLENLYIDDFIYSNAGDFLTHQYKFGTNEISFGSIVIFIFVLWVSIIISRVISYFYDFAEQQSEITNDVKKTRTSILLIRLAIFSLGFVAAIIFSGIPISEVTLIIGALGVGIGFGLQNIVNNLVSGIILAFEKPVQVGDIIEVGSRSGVIREIGIRASKIEAGNGSEIIVPNGDLISQHVINWTLTNNNRQIELVVGVAYGSDIAKVDEILRRILLNRTDLMQNPAPSVFLHNFSESSVDFKLLFWAADIKKWVSLKSNVMIEIYTEFAKEGVEIPHPKRDIQVFFPEGTTADMKNPEVLKEIFPKDEVAIVTPPKESPKDKGQ